MGPVEEALANKFLPKLMDMKRISVRLRNILALGTKRAGLEIPNPTETVDENHRTSRARSERLVGSLIKVEALSASEHRACVWSYIREGWYIK